MHLGQFSTCIVSTESENCFMLDFAIILWRLLRKWELIQVERLREAARLTLAQDYALCHRELNKWSELCRKTLQFSLLIIVNKYCLHDHWDRTQCKQRITLAANKSANNGASRTLERLLNELSRDSQMQHQNELAEFLITSSREAFRSQLNYSLGENPSQWMGICGESIHSVYAYFCGCIIKQQLTPNDKSCVFVF